MTINPALFSSKASGDHHATPLEFYKALDKEFSFSLDPCASVANHKAPEYLALDHPDPSRRDGLAVDWHTLAQAARGRGNGSGAIFVNPPYGRGIGVWIEKAAEAAKAGSTVVCLVPARTCTAWFHDQVLANNAEVRFIRGRLKFGGQKASAPFPSIVVIFRP